MMRLYGAIQKIEPQDDGTVRVYGIATSEAVDDQGEIVQADAMRAAIPEYMRFPALREMHQLSAAGTTLEAEVCEDGATRIVAHVVDPVAVAKVKNQVYRGFSIGGRVLQREPGDPKTITGLALNEISLVDRPANPEAVFDCWKAALPPEASREGADRSGLDAKSPPSVPGLESGAPFNPPIQVWACGVGDHRHVAKVDAVKCIEKHACGMAGPQTANDSATTRASGPYGDVQYADPGYQADKKKRYPIETVPHIRAAWNYINNPANAEKYTANQLARIKAAIIAAWREKIDKDGPPSANDAEKSAIRPLAKMLADIDRIAGLVSDLEWMAQTLGTDAMTNSDDAQRPARMREIVAELCEFLDALVTERTGDENEDVVPDRSPFSPPAPDLIAAAARAGGRSVDIIAKAKPSRADQTLLDLASLACDKCFKSEGLAAAEGDNVCKASEYLDKAGALTSPSFRSDMSNVRNIPPAPQSPPNVDDVDHMSKTLDVIAAVLSKTSRVAPYLIDVAHECLSELTDGVTCSQTAKVGARHSRETTDQLMAAHRHLVAAGANCDAATAAGLAGGPRVDDASSDKGARAEDLAKALADEHADKKVLGQALSQILPMLERLTERVDAIARTPLPPLTIAKGMVSVSKQQDRGGLANSEPALSQEAVASALAKMSKEQQTLTLIKASYANPIGTSAVEP
jgi:hypothetical protein